MNAQTTIPFAVADISGRLRRVNIDGLDFAIIDRVHMPFFGSKLPEAELRMAVSRAAAEMTGCSERPGVYEKRSNYGIKAFAVPMSCF
ncbi:MAG: hypothetical protein WA784_10065 [Albidovulum sp.]